VSLLASRGMLPSMSRPANPYDNTSCESFMRTHKREETYAHTYRELEGRPVPGSHLVRKSLYP